MKCELCKEFLKKYPLVKTEEEFDVDNTFVHKLPDCTMSEVQCAFRSEIFSENNWCCCTLDLIRDLCYERKNSHHYINYQYCEDQKYATINISYINEVAGDTLWISWYKNRGKTDNMWILDSYNNPTRPTEKDCLLIAKYFQNLIKEI